uniref:Uncharacterized protein n=1 Tax=Hemiselmis andersenii TaxID=464988 RepID=A0A6U4UTZ9_HEMAN|mmetsp:Transcript_241/g.543  ORF Transcript_241/g.543 Transcript_241/m.543 type:complete len:301 (+) Transcript_241:74-976(+)
MSRESRHAEAPDPPPPDFAGPPSMLLNPSTTFGLAGPLLSFDAEMDYFKPLPSDLLKRAQQAGSGMVSANVKLVEARQRGAPNPSANLLIDYKNTQTIQINYNVESKFRNGSSVYGLPPGTADKVGEVLWSVKEYSSYTGEFRVDIVDQAGFVRYTIKNIRRQCAEELLIYINHDMEVGSVGMCGFGSKPPDFFKSRAPDFVVTHPSRDRYRVVEGDRAGNRVVAEIDRHGQASFTTRVAARMDVALSLTLSWVIDRCRCRFDLASSRWRGHGGNVFYKGKLSWKPPPAVSLSRGGVKPP